MNGSGYEVGIHGPKPAGPSECTDRARTKMILETLEQRKIELDKQFQGGSIRERAVVKNEC